MNYLQMQNFRRPMINEGSSFSEIQNLLFKANRAFDPLDYQLRRISSGRSTEYRGQSQSSVAGSGNDPGQLVVNQP